MTRANDRVHQVIDGDTFETAYGDQPVGLLNVRAPKMHEPLGEEAWVHLLRLLEGRVVRMEFVRRDRHGRRLARVTCGGQCVNDQMNRWLSEQGIGPS